MDSSDQLVTPPPRKQRVLITPSRQGLTLWEIIGNAGSLFGSSSAAHQDVFKPV